MAVAPAAQLVSHTGSASDETTGSHRDTPPSHSNPSGVGADGGSSGVELGPRYFTRGLGRCERRRLSDQEGRVPAHGEPRDRRQVATARLPTKLTGGGSPLGGKRVHFQLGRVNVGTATTNTQGVATLPNVKLKGINSGFLPARSGLRFGHSGHSQSNGRGALTVKLRVLEPRQPLRGRLHRSQRQLHGNAHLRRRRPLQVRRSPSL